MIHSSDQYMLKNNTFNVYFYDNDTYLLSSSLVAKTGVDGCGKLVWFDVLDS